MRVPYILKLKAGIQFKSSAFSKFSSPIVFIRPPLSYIVYGILIKHEILFLSLKLFEIPPRGLILIIYFFFIFGPFALIVGFI
jgi:hypothetical protein